MKLFTQIEHTQPARLGEDAYPTLFRPAPSELTSFPPADTRGSRSGGERSVDGDALNKWLRAIPRKDFVPTSCTKACADHFDASCIERTTSYTDPRTGRVIEVALPVPRLRPGSVPTIFPGCPSYLSVSDHNTRETPDAKRSRKEASNSPMLLKNHWRHTKRNRKETVFRPSKN
ncbi:hypothetical protein HPB52_007545 [Rhipicephalus sanguineus]|uniref:THAP-type domain-containing protein n=1 Tax=Rhipicephalus sanguineus TaxID=34632 RepID=A0A9D4SU23_RHISA|nr:hypothetical protein HPB52_007545 [Rhipicephalus sanguineus]